MERARPIPKNRNPERRNALFLRRFPLWIALGAFAALFSAPNLFAGTLGQYVPPKDSCLPLLLSDQELLRMLPDRLRGLVESARFKRLVTKREADWEDFHRALDDALNYEGYPTRTAIGNLNVHFKLDRTKTDTPRMTLAWVGYPGLDMGKNLDQGSDFLELIAAQTAWVAEKRAQGRIRGLEIVGDDLNNGALKKLLASLGAKNIRNRNCLVSALASLGASSIGGVSYFLVHPEAELSSADLTTMVKNPAFLYPSVAGVLTTAVFCMGTKENFRIDFIPPAP